MLVLDYLGDLGRAQLQPCVTELESGETTADRVNVNLQDTKSDAARDGQYDVKVGTDKARWSEAVKRAARWEPAAS